MISPPRPQDNYQLAFERGLEQARGQSQDTLKALGAQEIGAESYLLPVLDARFLIDLGGGSVALASEEGAAVRVYWQILALHYLSAMFPWPEGERWVSFADFPDARGYEKVYRARVVGRLCATAGRERRAFAEACRRLGGQPVDLGDEGFRFDVFPRLSVIIAWYAGDGELPANASFLYPDNALSFLPVEDIIVVSEGVVSRLQGKGW